MLHLDAHNDNNTHNAFNWKQDSFNQVRIFLTRNHFLKVYLKNKKCHILDYLAPCCVQSNAPMQTIQNPGCFGSGRDIVFISKCVRCNMRHGKSIQGQLNGF